MIEIGQVFFTKSVALGFKKGSIKLDLKTHAIGLLLGVIPKGHTESVTENDLNKILVGKLGLIYLDDIEECLGKASHDKLVKFCTEKYK